MRNYDGLGAYRPYPVLVQLAGAVRVAVFHKRSRVVVAVGDDILLVKGWLGSGQWAFPGGGVHPGETSQAGAVRELREETGIAAGQHRLRHLLSARAHGDNGLKYRYYAYSLELRKKPPLARRKSELTHVEWIPWRDVYEDPHTSRDIKDILRAWQDSR